MDQIARRLAADILAAQGITCVVITANSKGCKVTVGDAAARGTRLWFRSTREAERVLNRLLNVCQLAQRRRQGGLTIAADADEVVALVRSSALAIAITPIEQEAVDEVVGDIASRVEAEIERLKKNGRLSRLNGEYAAERATAKASGTACPPAHSVWLFRRLQTELPRFTGVAPC
jgi:hypothetical protein